MPEKEKPLFGGKANWQKSEKKEEIDPFEALNSELREYEGLKTLMGLVADNTGRDLDDIISRVNKQYDYYCPNRKIRGMQRIKHKLLRYLAYRPDLVSNPPDWSKTRVKNWWFDNPKSKIDYRTMKSVALLRDRNEDMAIDRCIYHAFESTSRKWPKVKDIKYPTFYLRAERQLTLNWFKKQNLMQEDVIPQSILRNNQFLASKFNSELSSERSEKDSKNDLVSNALTNPDLPKLPRTIDPQLDVWQLTDNRVGLNTSSQKVSLSRGFHPDHSQYRQSEKIYSHELANLYLIGEKRYNKETKDYDKMREFSVNPRELELNPFTDPEIGNLHATILEKISKIKSLQNDLVKFRRSSEPKYNLAPIMEKLEKSRGKKVDITDIQPNEALSRVRSPEEVSIMHEIDKLRQEIKSIDKNMKSILLAREKQRFMFRTLNHLVSLRAPKNVKLEDLERLEKTDKPKQHDIDKICNKYGFRVKIPKNIRKLHAEKRDIHDRADNELKQLFESRDRLVESFSDEKISEEKLEELKKLEDSIDTIRKELQRESIDLNKQIRANKPHLPQPNALRLTNSNNKDNFYKSWGNLIEMIHNGRIRAKIFVSKKQITARFVSSKSFERKAEKMHEIEEKAKKQTKMAQFSLNNHNKGLKRVLSYRGLMKGVLTVKISEIRKKLQKPDFREDKTLIEKLANLLVVEAKLDNNKLSIDECREYLDEFYREGLLMFNCKLIYLNPKLPLKFVGNKIEGIRSLESSQNFYRLEAFNQSDEIIDKKQYLSQEIDVWQNDSKKHEYLNLSNKINLLQNLVKSGNFDINHVKNLVKFKQIREKLEDNRKKIYVMAFPMFLEERASRLRKKDFKFEKPAEKRSRVRSYIKYDEKWNPIEYQVGKFLSELSFKRSNDLSFKRKKLTKYCRVYKKIKNWRRSGHEVEADLLWKRMYLDMIDNKGVAELFFRMYKKEFNYNAEMMKLLRLWKLRQNRKISRIREKDEKMIEKVKSSLFRAPETLDEKIRRDFSEVLYTINQQKEMDKKKLRSSRV